MISNRESTKKFNDTNSLFRYPNFVKLAEYLFYVIFYIFISCFILFYAKDIYIKGILAQIQVFFAVLLTFRYGYKGLFTIIFLSFSESITHFYLFSSSSNLSLKYSFSVSVTVKAITIAAAYIIAKLVMKQERQREKLKLLAVTDELTKVYNQRFFHSSLLTAIENASQNNSHVGLVMLDIDNFKIYNDIYGHECGDKILSVTSKALTKILSDEIVCRYGGDEFAVIITDKNSEQIKHIASCINDDYKKIKDSICDNIYNKVTLSIGVSIYPEMAKDKDELISQADMALYHAKNLGKNKVHIYNDVIKHLRNSISSDHQQLIGIFKGLLGTISTKDKYTMGHCQRVSSYSVLLGEELGLSIEEINNLQYAGLLHDIGKIEIPKILLNKVKNLSSEELKILQEHPIYSANILEPLEQMGQLVNYVRHHHERYDGKGYPDGLKGEDISLGARILCVVDSFDAMISERPYSQSLTVDKALNELRCCSGTQFDPKIVDVFIKIITLKYNLSCTKLA